MRILIPTIGLDNRGGTRVNINLANHLAARGHDICVLVPRGSKTTTFDISPAVTIKNIGFSVPQINDISSIIRTVMLFPLLNECEVVIANYYLTSYPVQFSALFRHSRVNVNFIQAYEPLVSGEMEKTFPKLKRWLVETTYRFPMEQVTVAKWIADRVSAIHGRSVRVIHPNIDVSVFKPNKELSSPRAPIILAFPSHDIYKGWNDVIQAIPSVVEEFPNVKVWASSQNPFSVPGRYYKNVIPLNDNDLVQYYQAATLYVHASWFEGCPLSPLEAMACGTPVVAAASEGILEYAVDGENCLLVPPQSPDALAEAMIRLLGDRALHQRLIQGGLETVKRFAWPKMVDEFEQFLLDCVAQGGERE